MNFKKTLTLLSFSLLFGISTNTFANSNKESDNKSNIKNSSVKIGKASWYGPGFHGRKTANGERFNMNSLTAAHKSLPFGTKLKVTCTTTGKSVIVRVNDRGPFKPGRSLDLSKGAAQQLGMVSRGITKVKYEILN